ncbi:hypothetical protein [Polaromonas sp.]|uniref:hypothetical protein n=1 Tax=Polaromonas sp. TaxID=1869339 RepID=UPI0013BB9FC3|nr:hypothetical protein [Polaromonas sp.]NDP62686.1 hypothetical protein [Polaromonas sp.]
MRASGKLSHAGECITALLLSTVNGQRLGNLPMAGLSLRTGKFETEIGALESPRHELSLGMVNSCSRVNRNSL